MKIYPFRKKTFTTMFQKLGFSELGIMRHKSQGMVQVGGAKMLARWKDPAKGNIVQKNPGQIFRGEKKITASKEVKQASSN